MESRNTSRLATVECEEFRARHAEYVDGMLTTLAAARLASHVDACASCARYDRVVRKGAALLRDMPGMEPSPDFTSRLQHRIFHMQDERVLASPRPTAGAAAALGVAAFIALLAWSPVLFTAPAARATGSAVVPPATASLQQVRETDVSSSSLPDAEPVFDAIDVNDLTHGNVATARLPMPVGTGVAGWYPVTRSPQRATLVSFPGPHSPLIVTPPAHRSVRTIATGYRPVE